MLFNVKDDPHEQHDLAVERPDLCALACRYLTDWQEDMMLTSEDDRDPLWTTLLEGGRSTDAVIPKNTMSVLKPPDAAGAPKNLSAVSAMNSG